MTEMIICETLKNWAP